MSLSADALRKLAALRLDADQMAGVLEVLADMQAAEDDRKAKQRDRVRRHRERQNCNVTETSPSRCDDVTPTSPGMVPFSLPPNPLPITPLNPPTPQPVRRERRTFPEFFEKFWQAYPRRDGANPKQPAAQKFDRIVAGGVDPEAIIAAARKLAADMAGKDAKFVPQAQTWLGQARWQDDNAKQDTEPIQAVFIERGSPQWQAWTRFRGKEPLSTHHGGKEGQFMKSEWPPQETAA